MSSGKPATRAEEPKCVTWGALRSPSSFGSHLDNSKSSAVGQQTGHTLLLSQRQDQVNPPTTVIFLANACPSLQMGIWIRGSTQLYDATVSPIRSLWTACHANSLSGNRKMLSAQRKTRTQTHPIAVNVYQADKYV